MKYLVTILFLLFTVPATATVDPVSWWKFDAGTGTSAADSGTGANTGTLQGSATWGTGNVGAYALSTDGAGGNYVTVGDPGSGNLDFGTSSFSFSLWFKTSDNTSVALLLNKRFSGSCGSGDEGYYFIMASGGQFFASICGTATGAMDTDKTWTGKSDGAWHHAVVIVDRGNNLLKLYGDNVLIGSNTDITGAGTVSNTTGLSIAGDAFGTAIFNGLIDDVRIYNRVVTVAEIAAMYNQTESASARRAMSPMIFQ